MASTLNGPFQHPLPHAAAAWNKQSRAEALANVRSVMSGTLGSFAALEAAAEEICAQLSATSLTLVVIQDDQYWDAIDVGEPSPEHPIFAAQTPYSTSHYPVATRRLLSRGGYLGASDDDAALTEYRLLWPQMSVGSILGASLMSNGLVTGELFLLRDKTWAPFTAQDLEILKDLATVFASRLGLLLASDELQGGLGARLASLHARPSDIV